MQQDFAFALTDVGEGYELDSAQDDRRMLGAACAREKKNERRADGKLWEALHGERIGDSAERGSVLLSRLAFGRTERRVTMMGGGRWGDGCWVLGAGCWATGSDGGGRPGVEGVAGA